MELLVALLGLLGLVITYNHVVFVSRVIWMLDVCTCVYSK